jgi:hypothetical protein
MKSKTLVATAVAGAFACSTGAFAGNSWNAHEVRTPSSVDESAPWLANESHTPASASTMTFASTSGDRTVIDAPVASSTIADVSATTNTAYTEYWLLGSESADIGASSGFPGTGSIGFDSSMSSSQRALDGGGHGLTTSPLESSSAELDSAAMNGNELMSYSFEPAASAFEMVLFTPSAVEVIGDIGDATPLISEHYLIAAPDSGYDSSELVVLTIGPASEDLALLDSLKEHFIILTPAYGEA